MFLGKNFTKLTLCLLLIFKSSLAVDEKKTKDFKDQVYNERTHAGPMGMGLTKSYQINNQKICIYNTINGQAKITLESLDKVSFKKAYNKILVI